MKKLIVITALAVGATVNLTAAEDQNWFQASLTPDIAIHPKTTEIDGFAINIWGQNPQHSFNLGLMNGSTGDSHGLSLGIINYDASYKGVQLGAVNISTELFHGWQDGFLNYSDGTFVGLQSGWVNYANDFQGLQFGFVNYAQKLDGVQIGFVNVAMNNGWFDEFPDKLATAFPFVNWSF